MQNLNKITKILGATFVLVSSSAVLAQTLPNQNATATVQNTFTITKTTDLDFGTVRATNDVANAANFALMTLTAQGAVTYGAIVGASAITSLVAGTPGRFDITGAAPFTNLTWTDPALITLSPVSAPALTAEFHVTVWHPEVSGGANDGLVASNNVQTDAAGAVGVLVGAEIQTDTDVLNTAGYGEGAYAGTYTITIAY